MSNINPITTDEAQGLRLVKLLDEATNTLREYLLKPYLNGPVSFEDALKKEETKLRKILRDDQFDILFPKTGNTNPDNYDVSLLTVVLRVVRKVRSPKTGWQNEPLVTDQTDSAHIVRIYLSRNKLQHSRLRKDHAVYKDYIDNITTSMVALGCDINVVNIHLKQSIDPNTSALLDARLNDLNEADEKIQELEEKLEEIENVFTNGVWFDVLPLIPSFTGRTKDVDELHTLLHSPNGTEIATVLSGLPGTGKTSLASYYCYEYRETYDGNIVWINASGAESLKTSFKNLAAQMKLCTDDDAFNIDNIIAKIYKRFFEQRVLFVFDNADDPAAVLDFLPKPMSNQCSVKPSVLITSRTSLWGQRFREKSINNLSQGESLDLISNFLPKDLIVERESAEKLCDLLQGYPLAIQQSIAYMKYNLITVPKYLQHFKQAEEYGTLSFPADDIMYKHNFYGSLMITYASLKHSGNSTALEIINLLSFMDGMSINKKLLQNSLNYTSADVDIALIILEKLSLIQVRRDFKKREIMLRLHSLVQLVIRRELIKTGDHTTFISRLFTLIANVISEKDNIHHVNFGDTWINHVLHIHNKMPEDDTVIKYVAEHKLSVHNALKNTSNHVGAIPIFDSVKAYYMDTVGKYSQEIFDTDLLIVLALIGLNEWESCLDVCFEMEDVARHVSGHGNDIKAKHHIAFCLSALGRNRESLKVYKVLVEIDGYDLGEYHDTTISTEINIAMEYSYLNDPKEALQVINTTIQKLKSVPDYKQNPEYFLTSRNKIDFLMNLGRYVEARDFLEPLINESENELGETHKETLSLHESLALLLERCGKTKEAIEILQGVLLKKIEFLSPENPDVLKTQDLIAHRFTTIGEYREAINMHQDLLKKNINLHGEFREEVCGTKVSLSYLFCIVGFYIEALSLALQVVEFQKLRYEPDNFRLIRTQNCIGNCFLQLGLYEKALGVYTEVLKARLPISGVQTRLTFIGELNIAICLQHMGKYFEALLIYEKVHNGFLAWDAQYDEYTLISQYRLAECLLDVGRYIEGLEILTSLRNSGVFNANNLHMLRCTCQLARCQQILGRVKESKLNCVYVFEHGKEFTEWHAVKLQTAIIHAKCLIDQGNATKAISELNDLVTNSVTNLTFNLPSVLQIKFVIAIGLYELGKKSEALTMLEVVRSGQEEAIGSDHSHTLQTRFKILTLSENIELHSQKCQLEVILKKQIEQLGNDHLETLMTKREIARCLIEENKCREAQAVLQNVLCKLRTIVDEEHRDVLQTKSLYQHCLDSKTKNEKICLIL